MDDIKDNPKANQKRFMVTSGNNSRIGERVTDERVFYRQELRDRV